MNRVVRAALRLSGATGTGIWLFTEQELIYRAGAGAIANDERLQVEARSKLAPVCGHTKRLLNDPHESSSVTDPDAIRRSSSFKSSLVAPINLRGNILGALAMFSTEFNAFTEPDATRARLLSGLLTRALYKAEEAGLRGSTGQKRTVLLGAADPLISALIDSLQTGEQELDSPDSEFSSLLTQLELLTDLAEAWRPLPETSPPGQGGDVRDENSENTSTVISATERAELNPTDCILQGENLTCDELGTSDFLQSVHQVPEADPESIPTHRIEAAAIAGRRLPTYRVRKLKPRLLRLYPAATPLAMVLTILWFLFLTTMGGNANNAAASPAEVGSPARLASVNSRVAASEPSQGLHGLSDIVSPLPSSHMRVTESRRRRPWGP